MLFDRWQHRVLPWGHIGATWRLRLNLCILRPTRVHNRNGKCFGSAVFAQLTAQSAYILQWEPLSTRIALTGKFSKIRSERIHRDTDPRIVCKFREIWSTGSRWNRALLTWQKQNFRWLSRSRFCADRARNLPGPAANNVFRVPLISSKSVHFRRSYSRMREHRSNAP